MRRLKPLIFLIATLISFNTFSLCLDIKIESTEDYDANDNVTIVSADGVKLSANLLVPKNIEGKIPTIIFVNSWCLDEHEYIYQAKLLARRGYQVLSYSTRGWGCSEGYVDVVGPKDMQDVSAVVDWLEENTDVDSENIGITGISYGGGMTLMALAKEPRIKTGVAMSGWGSLTDSLFGNNTPRLFWGSLLVYSGKILGDLSPEISEMFKDIKEFKNIDNLRKWADKRSPITYIKDINERNVPIYLSNNFGDNLFQPNTVIEFYKALKTPKILDLNQGTHASGEASGLGSVNNYSFKKLHDWFDYWLRGIKNKLQLNTINIQVDLNHKRETYYSTSTYSENQKTLYLESNLISTGRLESNSNEVLRPNSRIFNTYFDSMGTTGIPLFSALFDGNFKVPTYSFIPLVNMPNALVYKSSPMKKIFKLRGIPSLKLNLNNPEKKAYQVNAYLYDLSPWGYSKLISHGVYTSLKGNSKGPVDFDLVATAYDLPKGHRIAIIIDGKDFLYGKPENSSSFLEILSNSKSLNVLRLPHN